MRKFTFDADAFSEDVAPVAMINTWHDLAIQLGIQTNLLSYAKRERDSLQKKIVIKKGKDTRVVYKSLSPLGNIQGRILGMLNIITDTALDKSQVLAYQKGVSAAQVLSENTDKKYLVKFDIKKYYDHINYRHIKATLMDHGFTRLGAQLVTKYCTVRRKIKHDGPTLETLQQGCVASPAISNLVGYKYIDQPIAAWIEEKKTLHPFVEFIYVRYSDNIAVWVDYSDGHHLPAELLKEFKQFVKDTLAKSRFWTHHWSTIPNNHPKRNQQFLGVVLNKQARVDKTLFSNWCSTLFNACRSGLDLAAYNYWEDRDRPFETEDGRAVIQTEVDIEKFIMVARGTISYIGSINPGQGLQLKKLLAAAELMYERHGINETRYYQKMFKVLGPGEELPDSTWVHKVRDSNDSGTQYVTRLLDDHALAVIKNYKDNSQTQEDFLTNLRQCHCTGEALAI